MAAVGCSSEIAGVRAGRVMGGSRLSVAANTLQNQNKTTNTQSSQDEVVTKITVSRSVQVGQTKT
jgi:hypothetical protein